MPQPNSYAELYDAIGHVTGINLFASLPNLAIIVSILCARISLLKLFPA